MERAGAIERLQHELAVMARSQTHRGRYDSTLVLDASGYFILSLLAVHGPMTRKRLAGQLGIDASTLTRQLAGLLSGGMVDSIADPRGGSECAATPAGLEALRADRDRKNAGLGRVLAGWSDADLVALAALLERLNTTIDDAIAATSAADRP